MTNQLSTILSVILLLLVSLHNAALADQHIRSAASSHAGAELELPAVDGINARFSVAKSFDETEILWGEGSLTIPLGHRFGLQLDVGAVELEAGMFDIPIYGASVHFFWRDPARGLIGVYADTIHITDFGGFGGINFHGVALETEQYWDRVTFENHLGINDGDYIDPAFFSRSTIAYYPLDALRLHVGHVYGRDHHTFTLGGEWGLGTIRHAATSLFVDSTISEGGDMAALTGFRVYLGRSNKSLIRRHREDDPNQTAIRGSLPGFGGAGLEGPFENGGLAVYFLNVPEFDFDLRNLINVLDPDLRRRIGPR